MFFKKRDPKPTPPWMNWLFIGIVAYAVIMHQLKGTEYGAPVREAIDNAADNLSTKKLGDLESYKDKIFPGRHMLQMHDIDTGKGNPTICGQEVKIAYQALIDNKEVDSVAKEKPLSFRIGQGDVMPALEQGVIGMRVGGKRSLMSPPSLAYGSKGHAKEGVSDKADTQFDIELLSSTPDVPGADVAPYRVIDMAVGQGALSTCGTPTKVNLAVWDVSGKKLFPAGDGPASFTITPGKSEILLGVEQGIIGMRVGSVRMLIVPPAFQKTMNGNAPTLEIPLPKQQTVLVEVEAVQ